LLCHLRHELIVSFSQVPLFLSKQASKQARPKKRTRKSKRMEIYASKERHRGKIQGNQGVGRLNTYVVTERLREMFHKNPLAPPENWGDLDLTFEELHAVVEHYDLFCYSKDGVCPNVPVNSPN
jgi:hypothetical protein